MLYNREQYKKIKDKKVMHKVKKQWVTVSVAMLMAIGGGAAVKHADNEANADASVTSAADDSQANHSSLWSDANTQSYQGSATASESMSSQSSSSQSTSLQVPKAFAHMMRLGAAASGENDGGSQNKSTNSSSDDSQSLNNIHKQTRKHRARKTKQVFPRREMRLGFSRNKRDDAGNIMDKYATFKMINYYDSATESETMLPVQMGASISSSATEIESNVSSIYQFISDSSDILSADSDAEDLITNSEQPSLSSIGDDPNSENTLIYSYFSTAANQPNIGTIPLAYTISDEYQTQDNVNKINDTVTKIASSAYTSESTTVDDDSLVINKYGKMINLYYGNSLYSKIISQASLESARNIFHEAIHDVDDIDKKNLNDSTGSKVDDANSEASNVYSAMNGLYLDGIRIDRASWASASTVVNSIYADPDIQNNPKAWRAIHHDNNQIHRADMVLDQSSAPKHFEPASKAAVNASLAAKDAESLFSSVNSSIISQASNHVNSVINKINQSSNATIPDSKAVQGDSNLVDSMSDEDPSNNAINSDQSQVNSDNSVISSVESAESSASASAAQLLSNVDSDSGTSDTSDAKADVQSADSYSLITSQNNSLASSAARDASEAEKDAASQLASDLDQASSSAEDTSNEALIASKSASSYASQMASDSDVINSIINDINNIVSHDPKSNGSLSNDVTQASNDLASLNSESANAGSTVNFINNNYDSVTSADGQAKSDIASSNASNAASDVAQASSLESAIQSALSSASNYNGPLSSMVDDLNSLISDASSAASDAASQSASDSLSGKPSDAVQAGSSAVKATASGVNIILSVIVNVSDASQANKNNMNDESSAAKAAAKGDPDNSLIKDDEAQIASDASAIASAEDAILAERRLTKTIEDDALADLNAAQSYSNAAKKNPHDTADVNSATQAGLSGSQSASETSSVASAVKSLSDSIEASISAAAQAASEAKSQSESDAGKDPSKAASIASAAAKSAALASKTASEAASIADNPGINNGAKRLARAAKVISSAASAAKSAASAAQSDYSIASKAASEAMADSKSAASEQSAASSAAAAGDSPSVNSDNSSANSYKSAASKAAKSASDAASKGNSAASEANADASTVNSEAGTLSSVGDEIASASKVISRALRNDYIQSHPDIKAIVDGDSAAVAADSAKASDPNTTPEVLIGLGDDASGLARNAHGFTMVGATGPGNGDTGQSKSTSTPPDNNEFINNPGNYDPNPNPFSTPSWNNPFSYNTTPSQSSTSNPFNILPTPNYDLDDINSSPSSSDVSNRQTEPASETPDSTRFVHHLHNVNNLNVNQTGNYRGNRITRLRVPSHFRWFYIIHPCLAHQNIVSVGSRKQYDYVLRPGHLFTARIRRFFKVQFHHQSVYRYEFGMNGNTYFATGNPYYTWNAYYQPSDLRHSQLYGIRGISRYHEVKVIAPCWIHSQHSVKVGYTRNNRVKYVKPYKRLAVRRVFSIGRKGDYQTRFELMDGRIMTANKNFVKLI